ncbi:metal ABC transporter substrate-binding protein [Prauserella marina]|uniref:Zinc/manganese transport system substrate-binding protein n=1 Tax=Prauserella marina TaxID=530584 RepID=A0A222W1C1_9PSEU|nr:zinc ABC transporter substrate-binding protein [Prauserella marina]ASR39761.1 metal ABC transporter substrate-binding protein [Prauserella marina]PWV78440.1 zinc/manganese transport system substrate-binding protein [Prauserella marina]SDC86036.1 zinc/manganese transport system substrate-binding protein [Prauserella marina]
MNASRGRRLLVAVPMVTGLLAAVAACGSGEDGGAADGRIAVIASTNVWGSVAAAVGGDKVAITSIIDDPSADPHSYQATAADAAEVTTADVLVSNGGGYDDFFTKMAEQAPEAKSVVAVADSEEGHDHDHGHDHGHEHGEGNEHVWYDLTTVGEVADQLAASFGEVDPGAKQEFADNAAAFKGELDELNQSLTRIGDEHDGTKVVATEPVAHYLLESAHIEDITPPDFANAIENETDVPVAAQEEMSQLVTGKQVAAVVNNEQTVTPVTTKITDQAKSAGVPVVNLTETLPEGVTDYISWMSGQIDALSGALNT